MLDWVVRTSLIDKVRFEHRFGEEDKTLAKYRCAGKVFWQKA